MTISAHSERPSAHAPPRRRAVRSPSPTEAAERAHIVRVVAAQPAYMGWLRDTVAAVIDREARRLADNGHHALATVLAERAAGYRDGSLAVW
jgi:hypothetical protein